MMSLFDNKHFEYTIAPGCPWYEAQQSYGPPNVNWCENTYCTFINEPANTWSNLGFLIVGIILIRKLKPVQHHWFGWIILVMGAFSSIYHATNNSLSQYFDFVGMAMMTSYLAAFAWGRVNHRFDRPWQLDFLAARFWFFVAMNFVVLMCLKIMGIPIQAMLAFDVIPLLLAEIYLGVRGKSLLKERYVLIALPILIFAQICAQYDLKRIYCDPSHPWLHGHVLWHLLCAVGMFFMGLHILEHSPYELRKIK